MTNDQRQAIAAQLISEFAKGIEYSSIREHLSDEVGKYSSEDAVAIYELIHQAEIDIFWP